ncbi:MAG: hypothetical protein J0H73_15930 [Salana multivorans]|uniref:FGGY family carbohydrate kinase n=1 Tax=Salana multivorans TaxID=120377 RepID=UPI0009601671|nr:FGGY family carbohydrate kinase [Salana multivorans]MBN8883785.1 hypothetical protein [Salana multivorans]OJX97487.1 MAG: hypothetical protein BGO96_06200 [Micrococcales bacterium 73-15]
MRDTTPVVLGIDLGTTGVKVVAVDVGRGVVGTESAEHPTRHPGADGHEQDPDRWWSATCAASRRLLRRLADEGRPVVPAAVGLAGQMHSLLLLDGSTRPVRPAMTWADRRVGAATARLARSPRFEAVTGNAPVDAFTAPKLAWLAEHEPDALARARHLVLAKDWLGLRLTGELATDPTDALGTLLWDPAGARWDEELFGLCGADARLGVPVLASAAVRGRVTRAAAAETGIPDGTPVVTGAGDVSAAAMGGGARLGGGLCLNVGTAAQVMGAAPDLRPGLGFVFGSADGAGFVRMASVYAAGASVRAFERDELDGGAIGPVAAGAPAGARGLSYLPYMFGIVVPRKDDTVRGGFVGSAPEHTPAERAGAVLEGVAFACADVVEAVAEQTGARGTLTVVGGVASSPRFRAALAATVCLRVRHVPAAGSPLAAAMLAGTGSGLLAGPEELLALVPGEWVDPGPEAGEYREARARFRGRVEEMLAAAARDGR